MTTRPPTLSLSRPLDPLAAERLEMAGVSVAQPAEAASTPPARPFRHVPADPETFAHNQMREAAWHAAPVALEALLRDLAPAVFNGCPPPLAIGIDVALIELLAGEFEAPVIARFLAEWVRRPAYLASLARGDVRRDLNGCPAGTPDDNDRRYAAILLSRRGGAP